MHRLLFVITTSDVGGTESFLEQLVSRLDRRRFAATVCSLCPPGRVAGEIAAAGTEVITLDMAPRVRPGEMVAAAFRLARIVDRHDVDLIQSMLYRADALAALAARLSRRRPAVVGGRHSLTPMSGWTATLAARATRRLFDRTVAVSAAVRDQLVRVERYAPEHIEVIGNGVDTDRFRPRATAEAAVTRRRLGIGPETVLVGGVGRLAAEKAFELLIEAVAMARGRGVDLELVLAGEGPERARLEASARERGVADRVRLLGRRDDLDQVYPALDVFALSSREEGSPYALLEAMACGRAVAATAVGGVPEIVEPERSGLLVPPGSAAALAEALIRLAGDPALRAALGGGARARIEARFGLPAMVDRYQALYTRLLRAEAGRGDHRRRDGR